jgi:hypothetical protein
MAYIFGGSTGETPESVARKRAIAAALMGGSRPRTFGEGLSAIGVGISARILVGRASRAEAAGRESAAGLLSGLGLGGSPVASDTAQPYASMGDGSPEFDASSPELAQGIAATAQAIGMDPVDLATIISYETGGTFDPTKAGPTTQWGQHRGLIQFGEPQAKEYGVDWSNPIGSQLGPEGAVAKYFLANGYQPGMGLLDAYSIVNAGGPGRYGASDANNGGAPGSVADKVRGMQGHYTKAQQLMAGLTAPAGNPRQGIASALEAVNGMAEGGPLPFADAAAGDAAAVPAFAPQPPSQGARRPVQFAQAGQPDLAQIMRVMEHPWATEGQKAVAAALLKQRLEMQDPRTALELQKLQLDIQKAEQPDYGFIELPDGTIVRSDPRTGGVEPAFKGAGKRTVETIYTPEGQEQKVLMNPDGTYEPIGGPKAPSGLTVTTNPDGTTTVTQGVGKVTESQSKDAFYLTRAAGAMPDLERMGAELTDFASANGGRLPIIGNYLKTDAYRQAENAALEWVSAILRKDSGAALTAYDVDVSNRIWIPQPGDDVATLQRKTEARGRATYGLRLGLTPEQIIGLERGGVDVPDSTRPAGAPAAAPAAAPVPAAPSQPSGRRDGGDNALPPAFLERYKDRSASARIRLWNGLSDTAREAFRKGLMK